MAAKVEEMRGHAKWKEIMEFGGQTAAFGETVDSYMSQLVRGFESEAKFRKGRFWLKHGDRWQACRYAGLVP